MSSENNLSTSEVPEKSGEDDTKANLCRPRQQKQNRHGLPLRACRNCGKVWKYEHYCPAEETKCQLCGKIGHWAQVCRSSEQYDNTNKSRKYNNDNQKNFRRRNEGEWKQNNRESDVPNNLNKNTNEFGNCRYNNECKNQDVATKNEDFKTNFKTQGNHGKERRTFNKDNNDKSYQNSCRNNFLKNSDTNNTDDDKCYDNYENRLECDEECADDCTKKNTVDDKVDSDEKTKKFGDIDKNEINKNYDQSNQWRVGENGFEVNLPGKIYWRSKIYKKEDRKDSADEDEFEDGKMFDEENKNDSDNSEDNNSEDKWNSASEESSNRRNISYSCAGVNQPVFDENPKYIYTSVGQSRYDPRQNNANNDENENFAENYGKNPITTPRYSYQSENDSNLIGLERKLADSFYQKGDYAAAISHYSRLIELCPKDPVSFNNRCACSMAREKYKHTFTDAITVVNLDSSCIEGYRRLIKCTILLGEITAAETNLWKLSQLDPKNKIIPEGHKKLKDLQKNMEKQKIAVNSKNYTKALRSINKCLLISSHCLLYKIQRAEYLALLKHYDEAKELVDEILQKDSKNIEARYISGICLYYSDIDVAVDYLKDLLRFDPDHTKILELYRKAKIISNIKKDGNNAFVSMDFFGAHRLYSLALGIDKDNAQIRAKLYYSMGQASYNIENFKRAIEEYTKVINIDNTNFKALKQRGVCYMKMKEYEEAIADFTRVCELNHEDDCQKLIKDSEKLLASVKKDFYEILGISKDASIEEIKKAFNERKENRRGNSRILHWVTGTF